jgi:flagellar biosynthesis GTPase FlhF
VHVKFMCDWRQRLEGVTQFAAKLGRVGGLVGTIQSNLGMPVGICWSNASKNSEFSSTQDRSSAPNAWHPQLVTQQQAEASRSTQKHAEASRSTQKQAEARRSKQKQAEASRSKQKQAEASRSKQKQAEASRSTQKHAEASRSKQKHAEARRSIPAGATQIRTTTQILQQLPDAWLVLKPLRSQDYR